MSHLLDDEGHVYKQGVFSDEWRQQQGFLGPEKDTDWLNRPNVRRDLLGRPEQARNVWGQPIYSAEGRPLYRPAGSSAPSSGGDAAAALLSLLLSIGLLILLVYLVSAIVALIVEILGALVNGWRSLVKRYPRAMRIVHLLLGMLAVGGGLYLKGFDLPVQVAGAALVPALWGWLWLTRRLPLVFMPINALLVGGGLWLLAQATRPTWGPTWSRLTFDLPLVDNLPFLLALLPMSLWLWRLGAQRWPRVFRPLNLLALGALLGFLLLRVWPDWRPAWERWVAPVPLLPSLTGWLIVFLPLGVWLWRQGQSRWPLPFTVLHLLLLGGLVGLTAYHTQPAWLDAWRHWMAGLPFAAVPILTVSLAPVTLWTWNRASRRWTNVLLIPNLLLSGGILWLVLDRTRGLWIEAWQALWGEVPRRPDPALIVLVLPLAVWLWGQGSRRWPRYWGVLRALMWGGVLWWIVERTRGSWYEPWIVFAGPGAPDPAFVVLILPSVLWIGSRLQHRWPQALRIATWTMLTLLLAWIVGRLWPDTTFFLRAGIACLPLAIRGWLWLLRRSPWVGWLLTLLPWVGLIVLVWLAPLRAEAVVTAVIGWLAGQGLPIGR